jgi:hypothetical protein
VTNLHFCAFLIHRYKPTTLLSDNFSKLFRFLPPDLFRFRISSVTSAPFQMTSSTVCFYSVRSSNRSQSLISFPSIFYTSLAATFIALGVSLKNSKLNSLAVNVALTRFRFFLQKIYFNSCLFLFLTASSLRFFRTIRKQSVSPKQKLLRWQLRHTQFLQSSRCGA